MSTSPGVDSGRRDDGSQRHAHEDQGSGTDRVDNSADLLGSGTFPRMGAQADRLNRLQLIAEIDRALSAFEDRLVDGPRTAEEPPMTEEGLWDRTRGIFTGISTALSAPIRAVHDLIEHHHERLEEERRLLDPEKAATLTVFEDGLRELLLHHFEYPSGSAHTYREHDPLVTLQEASSLIAEACAPVRLHPDAFGKSWWDRISDRNVLKIGGLLLRELKDVLPPWVEARLVERIQLATAECCDLLAASAMLERPSFRKAFRDYLAFHGTDYLWSHRFEVEVGYTGTHPAWAVMGKIAAHDYALAEFLIEELGARKGPAPYLEGALRVARHILTSQSWDIPRAIEDEITERAGACLPARIREAISRQGQKDWERFLAEQPPEPTSEPSLQTTPGGP